MPLHFLKRQIIMSESNIINFIFATSGDNENAFEVSYLVGRRVGKVKIQFCVRSLKKAGEQVAKLPLSNNTVHHRTNDMSSNLEATFLW
jgi:hypothetical protein